MRWLRYRRIIRHVMLFLLTREVPHFWEVEHYWYMERFNESPPEK
jgi:hypothetical protein